MSRIQASVELLAETLQSKNQDYTASRGEFINFEKSADFIRVPTEKVILSEIAKKMTRLESLIELQSYGRTPNNESLKDTLLDLAGYAVIAHAYVSDKETAIREKWNPAG